MPVSLPHLSLKDIEGFKRLGISEELLTLARVERVTDAEAREKFGIFFDGPLEGIVFPYYIDGHRVTSRLRRDHPERDGKGRLDNKYISAYGDHRHLYALPGYEARVADPQTVYIYVEAEKSVLAIEAWAQRMKFSRPILAFATGGCDGWSGKIGIRTTADGERDPEKGPLPEVSWARDGRAAAIIFDANASSNPKVARARKKLREQLEKQGVKVSVFDVPAIDGVNGVDDLIAVAGDQTFLDILEGPRFDKDLKPQPLNDYGNALRLIEVHGDGLRYCPPMKKWLIWDARRWQIDEVDLIRKLTQQVMLEFARQAVLAGNDVLSKFAGQCLNSQRLSAVIREAQPRLPVSPDELDRDPWLLNFRNGTLDLRTFELLPHSREHLITKLVQYNYDPHAQCPRFLAFLDRSVGAPLMIFVQKAMGYSVTGVTSEKTNFLCLGPTNGGKTTFLNLFRDLFEEYSAVILIDALMQREEDNNSRADLADLRGARLAMTSETEEGQRLREGKLKRITQGQGKIKSVRKYENPIQFDATHVLWIDANHKPLVRGTDDATWNRLTPIPFDRPLAESEIDKEMPAKLREEAEGIIAWAVAGTCLWQREGLGKPLEVEYTRSKWRVEMDRLGSFREECCVEGPKFSVQARPLYKAYREWAEDAGERPMSEMMFGLRMVEAGRKKDRDAENRVIYVGIALKDLFHG
jgi:P4 family phage/plasmid primase-like protien